jgi:hypothetical protein
LNPEPLATIRQGTDYAIAQLESVYQARRRCEKELAQLSERRAALQKENASGGTVAKVWVTPADGTVTASWMQADRSWTPVYELRAEGGDDVVFKQYAKNVALTKNERATLHLSSVHNPDAVAGFSYLDEAKLLRGDSLKLVTLKGGTNGTPLAISLENSTTMNLVSGEVACFKAGVYMGKGIFPGAEAGKPAEILCNNR